MKTTHTHFKPLRLGSFIVLLLSFSMLGYSQFLFDVQRTFETNAQTYDARTLTKTPDGGAFIVANNANDTLTIIRMDSNQSILWSKSHYINKVEVRVKDAEYTSDGGVIIGGTSLDDVGSGLRGFLIKADMAGDITSHYEYADTQMLVAAVIEAPFGYMVVGHRHAVTGTKHGVIMGVNHFGQSVGSYVVESTKSNSGILGVTELVDIIEMEAGRYACIGRTNSFANSVVNVESDAIVILVDQNGIISGNWVYGKDYPFVGASLNERGIALEYLPNEDKLLCLGHVRSENTHVCGPAHYDDLWVWKIDASNGSVSWSYQYDVANYNTPGAADNAAKPGDLVQIDNEIAICGSMELLGANNPSFILRTSASGVPTSERIYYDNHPFATNELYNMYASNHGSYVMAGESDMSGAGSQIYTVESYDLVVDSCEVFEPEIMFSNFMTDPIPPSNLWVQYVNEYSMSWDFCHLDFIELEHCPRIEDMGPSMIGADDVNPAESDLYIVSQDENSLTLASKEIDEVYGLDIYTALGKRVSSSDNESFTLIGEGRLTTSELPAGVYIVRARSAKKEATLKFFVK